ncbi:MAG: hypothetical protein ACO1QS_01405 [Verrucomicrobiota bacterium]
MSGTLWIAVNVVDVEQGGVGAMVSVEAGVVLATRVEGFEKLPERFLVLDEGEGFFGVGMFGVRIGQEFC